MDAALPARIRTLGKIFENTCNFRGTNSELLNENPNA